MAVQKSKVSRSRRGQRRSHDALSGPTLTTDSSTGLLRRRHNIATDGTYRGEQVLISKASTGALEESSTDPVQN